MEKYTFCGKPDFLRIIAENGAAAAILVTSPGGGAGLLMQASAESITAVLHDFYLRGESYSRDRGALAHPSSGSATKPGWYFTGCGPTLPDGWWLIYQCPACGGTNGSAAALKVVARTILEREQVPARTTVEVLA